MPQPSKKEMSPPAHKIIYGAPEGQDARILAKQAIEAAKSQKIAIHIALDDGRVDTLKDLLQFFAPDIQIIEFPAWDCLPYDRVSPSNNIAAKRVGALTELLTWQQDDKYLPRILLTTVNAVLQRVTPRQVLEGASFIASKGMRIDLEHLQNFLITNGYMRTDTVREAGEYAVRGGIVDIFPTGYDAPVRIDLFGDEIESIRSFDAVTQRTEGKLDNFTLKPVSEFFMDQESIARFRKNYREMFGAVRDDDPLYTAVTEGRRYNGMDHWLPFFFEQDMPTLFECAPANVITLDPQIDQAAHERLTQIEDFYQARKTLEQANATRQRNAQKNKNQKKGSDVSMTGAVYHPLPASRLYLDEITLNNMLGEAAQFSSFGPPDESAQNGGAKRGRDFADIRALPDGNVIGEVQKHIAALQAQGKKALIASLSLIHI